MHHFFKSEDLKEREQTISHLSNQFKSATRLERNEHVSNNDEEQEAQVRRKPQRPMTAKAASNLSKSRASRMALSYS